MPNTFNHYPVGWAHAMNTPLQWMKQNASHFGGTRNGLVIPGPPASRTRAASAHNSITSSIAPTILEAAGLSAPTSINGVVQKPVEGASMVYTFDDVKAPSKRTTQYFEMAGNRAIYHEGWVAATTPPSPPWSPAGVTIVVDDYKWELYNVREDFSQSNDLALREPAKLKELQELFWKEAEKYNVLPIDNSKVERLDVRTRPSLTVGRNEFTYFPGLVRIPEGAAPDTKNKSYQIKAEIDLPQGGAEGILLTQGGRFGGYGMDIDIAAVVFDFGIQTKRPNVVLSGASLYLKAWDKLQQNPISMGSRFTYCNHPEALARVLYQIIAMRLEESIQQMERLKAVLPTCTDAEKKATIERELDATLAKLGVKWTHHENAGPAQQEAA